MESGQITAKTEEVNNRYSLAQGFTTTIMVTNTKDNGKMVKDTAKVLCFDNNPRNSTVC